MKLLIAADDFFEDSPGGGARVPWELAKVYAARGHDVTLLARGPVPRRRRDRRSGVRLVRYPWDPSRPLHSLYLGAHAATHYAIPPDVVHIHQPFTGAAALLSGRVGRAPVVYFYHSSWGEEFLIRRGFGRRPSLPEKAAATAMRLWEKRVLDRAGTIVTLSWFMSENLQKTHGTSMERVRVIPGGVDFTRFRPGDQLAARRALGWPRESLILFTARNLEARMGLENLLEALPVLVKQHPTLRLYIAGAGGFEKLLRERARALGVGETAAFLGLLPEEKLPLAYQAADLFVLPSRLLEGFGLVTLEALASGCPVLGTPVGGTGEILSDFSPALLTDGNAPEDIRQGIEGFLSRRDREAGLREAAAAYARRKYGWDRMAASVDKLTM